jgi:ethanolamine ammonia-lyase small subunit
MTAEGRRRIPAFLQDLVITPEPVVLSSAYVVRVDPSRRPELSSAHNAEFLDRLVQATPSRIATGRTGTRYRASTYLALRGDHAIAKDAVTAEISSELANELGCIPVVSRCPNREHYLLHPNDGRRLSEESRGRLSREGTRDVDVQVILADGLAAPALRVNGPRLLPSLLAELQARGISVGRPILARLARVGLQDDIGVLLGARATVICLGERPGLGTGDSLSIYLAVGPKLEQDNAEKNCVSNIRPQGLSPETAAEMAANLLRRGLDLGRGGLQLV